MVCGTRVVVARRSVPAHKFAPPPCVNQYPVEKNLGLLLSFFLNSLVGAAKLD